MAIKTQSKGVIKKTPVKVVPAQRKPVVKKPAPVSSGTDNIQKILDTHSKHLEKIDATLDLLTKELRELKSTIISVKTSLPPTGQVSSQKKTPDSSWHSLIEPNREYTQKEIIGITKISQPTLSMAKVRGHIVTKEQPGKRGWVVVGSELLKWDNARARNTTKKGVVPEKTTPEAKKTVSKTTKKTAIRKAAPKALAVPSSAKTGKSLTTPKKQTKALAVQSQVKAKAGTTAKKPVKPTGSKKPVQPVKKPATNISNADIQVPVPNDIPDRISALTQKKVVTQTQFGHDVGLSQKVVYEITTRKRKELNPAIIQKITTVLKKYESK